MGNDENFLNQNINSEKTEQKQIKYFSNEENTFDSKLKTYQTLKHNLLQLKGTDNAIKTKKHLFDLHDFLNDEQIETVLEKPEFEITFNLPHQYKKTELSLLENADSFEELSILLEQQPKNLFNWENLANLENNFLLTKQKIIKKIKQTRNKLVNAWKKIIKTNQEEYDLRNVWSTYICYGFVEIIKKNAHYYGPLILKKVEIKINTLNKITIRTLEEGKTFLNEKMLFLLKKNFGLDFPKLKNESAPLMNLAYEAMNILKNEKTQSINLNNKFHKIKPQNVVQTKQYRWKSGLVVALLNPGGYELRRQMIKLIDNEMLEDLIDIDPIRNFVNETKKSILSQESKIKRIGKLDFSQEQAVIGALNHSILIYGPPGTGKSETISNIIANLLFQNQSALITSEKKAALDVLLEKLKELRYFVFFYLNQKGEKNTFYQRLQKWKDHIFNESFQLEIEQSNFWKNSLHKHFISTNQNLYRKQVRKLRGRNINRLTFIYKLNVKNNIDNELFHKLWSISKENQTILIKIIRKQWWKNIIFHLKEDFYCQKTFLWFFKYWPKNIKNLLWLNQIRIKLRISDQYFLEILQLDQKDLEIIFEFEDLIENERSYIEDHVNHREAKINETDENISVIIDEIRKNIISFKFNECQKKYGRTKLWSFLRAIDSAWQLPNKFMKKYENIIKTFFPIFVSTPNEMGKIVDFENDLFDYIIFDEASQLRCEKALPFLNNVDKIVVAGDHQQMEPTNYFEMRDEIKENEEENEEDTKSFLKYCQIKGFGTKTQYMLTKNYRSKNFQLMQFSANEFYDGKLKVLDHQAFVGQKAIEVFNVKGEYENRKNIIEADKLLNFAESKLKFAENKTIVLLTMNSPQKDLLEKIIFEKQEQYREINRLLKQNQLKLRSLEHIQGDEADYVFITVTYTKDCRIGSTYLGKTAGRKALNVAISRAKEKMFVFKSIKANEVNNLTNDKSIVTFINWLKFLDQESNINRQKSIIALNQFSSENNLVFYEGVKKKLQRFEKQNFIVKAGWSLGSYKLDFVIFDRNQTQIVCGIKIENVYNQNNQESVIDLIEINDFLTAKGYQIVNISELLWYDNPHYFLNKIQSILNGMKNE